MAEFNPDNYSDITFGEDEQEAQMEFSHLLLHFSMMSAKQLRFQVLQLLLSNIRFNINELITSFTQTIDIIQTCDC